MICPEPPKSSNACQDYITSNTV